VLVYSEKGRLIFTDKTVSKGAMKRFLRPFVLRELQNFPPEHKINVLQGMLNALRKAKNEIVFQNSPNAIAAFNAIQEVILQMLEKEKTRSAN
jgi:hypothetical protein